ncbi:ATP-binding protein [Alphaproteobacteria bacterium KMM 3653]|uniref:ATP-binding protein n=1 Tax=Harenicola maris TaxID=2841044 RepID=A0AAP2G572_9RHOB|nr:ATP-binding protein [Harenicola maris]
METTYAEPLPLLLLGRQVRDVVKSFPNCRFSLRAGKNSFHTYADHIGFFRFMGGRRGREPGEAWGSNRYIPIESFDIGEIQAAAKGGAVGEIMDAEASRLAIVLSQQDSGALFDVIQYTIREIIRNSAEHSRGTQISLMAQYWPAKGLAEIVITDDGVGIPYNIYENEYVECSTAREALKFALLPGVSGVSRQERAQQDEFWGNSGFGLYVTSRLCSENGGFRIISADQGLTLVGATQVEHDWSFRGTCVQLRLNVRDAIAMKDAIPRLVEEGETKRASLISRYPIQASAASKMLASQYRKL